MAFFTYLKIGTETLPLPDSYDVSLNAVEADTKAETEAGTTQRDVIRQGVVTIQVSFTLTATWVKKMTEYSKQDSLNVEFFDTETLGLRETQMYITGFQAKLEKDTSKKGMWTVSFSLIEY